MTVRFRAILGDSRRIGNSGSPVEGGLSVEEGICIVKVGPTGLPRRSSGVAGDFSDSVRDDELVNVVATGRGAGDMYTVVPA